MVRAELPPSDCVDAYQNNNTTRQTTFSEGTDRPFSTNSCPTTPITPAAFRQQTFSESDTESTNNCDAYANVYDTICEPPTS